MVRIDVSTLISRPVQEVWDFFIDLTNSSHWTRSGSELRKTSDGPLGVGTTIESVKPMLGREIKSQRLVATRYEPPNLVSFTAVVPILGELIGGLFESPDTVGADGPRGSRRRLHARGRCRRDAAQPLGRA